MKQKKFDCVAFGVTAMCSPILTGAAGGADKGLLDAVRGDDTPGYYESGFPHGTDQFISASATAWAAIAFAYALGTP